MPAGCAPSSLAGVWDLMNATSCLRGSTLGTIRYWMFGRSKLATKCFAAPSCSRSVISLCVAAVAVAVSHARHPGEPLAQVAQGEVVGAEVVTPLRHAVRLVDRDHAERSALKKSSGLRAGKTLRCDVDEVELAGDVRPLDLATLIDGLRGVEIGGVDAVGSQRIDLVVHERDQRADHEPGALAHEPAPGT